MRQFIRPEYLKPGDTVGVVAAASSLTDQQLASDWRTVLESWDLKIKTGKHLYDRINGGFAGEDVDRAEDIIQMVLDPEVKAIISFRGGYGSMRTLSNLDMSIVIQHPKWFVGFSDITVIHAALQKYEIESILGAMPGTFLPSMEKDISAISLRDALFGKINKYEIDSSIALNHCGTAQGRLIGGNLTLIRSTIGTAVENHFDEPTILFIEDVDEKMYRVDSMLVSLKLGGYLDRVSAIIVGYFTDTVNEDSWGCSVYELIKKYIGNLNIPVLFGFPCGHEQPNLSLYLGREVKITVNEQGGTLLFL